MKKILPVVKSRISSVITEKPEDVIAQLLITNPDRAIFLGDCSMGSVVVSDFFGYVRSFNFQMMRTDVVDFPQRKLFVILINKNTDFNTLERFNKEFQSAQFENEFVVVVEKNSLSSLPPSLFSRIMPYQSSLKFSIKNPSVPIQELGIADPIVIDADPISLLHHMTFSDSGDILHFSSTLFNDAVRNAITNVSGPLHICFKVNTLMPDHDSLIKNLNLTQRLGLYGIDFTDCPTILFSVKTSDVDNEARLKKYIENGQIKRFDAKLEVPLVELTNFNCTALLKNAPVFSKQPDGTLRSSLLSPIPDAVYVGSLLSSDVFHMLLDWLVENPSRYCYIESPKCFNLKIDGFDPKHDSKISCATIGIDQVFKNLSKPLSEYMADISSEPSTFLVSKNTDFLLLRSHINQYPNSMFYLTSRVYEGVTEYGPLLNLNNVKVINQFDKLSETILKKVPGVHLYLSDTVLLRIMYLSQRFSLDEAIDVGLIRGLPKNLRSQIRPLSVSYEKLASYSSTGILSPTVHNQPSCFVTLDTLSLYPQEPNLVCVTPISEKNIRVFMESLSYMQCPVYLESQHSSPVCQYQKLDNLNSSIYSLLDKKGFIIGEQQKKIIDEVIKGVHLCKAKAHSHNTSIFLGAAGTGKDELTAEICNELAGVRFLVQEVFNPAKMSHYFEIIRTHHQSDVGVLNLQEFNLYEEDKDFINLILYARQFKNIFILATGNNYLFRPSLSETTKSLARLITIDTLSDDDLRLAINRFVETYYGSTDDANYRIETLNQAVFSSNRKQQINFRLLNTIAECGIVLASHEWVSFLELLFDVELPKKSPEKNAFPISDFSEKTEEWDIKSQAPLPPLPSSNQGLKRSNLLNFRLVFFLMSMISGYFLKTMMFPWLLNSSGTELKHAKDFHEFPPLINTSYLDLLAGNICNTTEKNISVFEPEFKLETLLTTPEIKKKKNVFETFSLENLQPVPLREPNLLKEVFTSEQLGHSDFVIYGFPKGTVLNPEKRDLGQMNNVEYWKQVLNSNVLNIDNNGRLFGSSDPEKLMVHPYYPTEDEVYIFENDVQNYLGKPLYDALLASIRAESSLESKVNVLKLFYTTLFTYQFIVEHPDNNKDGFYWLDPFLRSRSGVCAHFARFAFLVLTNLEPGLAISTISILQNGKQELHEQLLVNRKLIDVTVPRRVLTFFSLPTVLETDGFGIEEMGKPLVNIPNQDDTAIFQIPNDEVFDPDNLTLLLSNRTSVPNNTVLNVGTDFWFLLGSGVMGGLCILSCVLRLNKKSSNVVPVDLNHEALQTPTLCLNVKSHAVGPLDFTKPYTSLHLDNLTMTYTKNTKITVSKDNPLSLDTVKRYHLSYEYIVQECLDSKINYSDICTQDLKVELVKIKKKSSLFYTSIHYPEFELDLSLDNPAYLEQFKKKLSDKNLELKDLLLVNNRSKTITSFDNLVFHNYS